MTGAVNGIIVHEVGMRDGLQVEKQVVPTEQKIAWIERLAASGVDFVQAGSFVNPKVLPQMADTDAVFAHFARRGPGAGEGARLTALVLNEKGLERGLAAGSTCFCTGVSARLISRMPAPMNRSTSRNTRDGGIGPSKPQPNADCTDTWTVAPAPRAVDAIARMRASASSVPIPVFLRLCVSLADTPMRR